MRGKLIVGIMLAGGIVMLGVYVWFFSSTSPIDERFNLERTPITPDTDAAWLLPERVGDFFRRSLTPVARDAQDQLQGSATYSQNGGQLIIVTVQSIAGQHIQTAPLEALTDSSFKLHPEAKFPYGYRASGEGSPGDTFIWVNGTWVFQASTPQANSELLLEFVNGYPY